MPKSTVLLVLYPRTSGINSSVYLNRTSDRKRIAATDLTVQRLLHVRFDDANSAYG